MLSVALSTAAEGPSIVISQMASVEELSPSKVSHDASTFTFSSCSSFLKTLSPLAGVGKNGGEVGRRVGSLQPKPPPAQEGGSDGAWVGLAVGNGKVGARVKASEGAGVGKPVDTLSVGSEEVKKEVVASVGAADGLTVGLAVGLILRIIVSITFCSSSGTDMDPVKENLKSKVTEVGPGVGREEIVGDGLGTEEGTEVGLVVGAEVGKRVGPLVGVVVGETVGPAVGPAVEVLVGLPLGLSLEVTLGLLEGLLVGEESMAHAKVSRLEQIAPSTSSAADPTAVEEPSIVTSHM